MSTKSSQVLKLAMCFKIESFHRIPETCDAPGGSQSRRSSEIDQASHNNVPDSDFNRYKPLFFSKNPEPNF